MAVERTIYCDGPDCGGEDRPRVHVTTAMPPPYLPSSFLEVRGDRAGLNPNGEPAHFCSWDCLMKFAAAQPMDEIIGEEEI